MRIRELLENKNWDEADKVVDNTESNQDDGLEFDLVEDLVFYMNNDDDAYRRHMYPSILKCIHNIENKIPTKPSMFKVAVSECFKSYSKQFPVRGIPDELDEEQLSEICEKLHDDVCKHASEGKYKD